MEKLTTIFSKSYDLNIEVFKKISTIQQEQKEFLLSQRLADSVSYMGVSAYLLQEIKSRMSFSFRSYSIRKACYQTMFYINLMRDYGSIDKKVATSWLDTLVEVSKMVNASISTINKKGKKTEVEELAAPVGDDPI